MEEKRNFNLEAQVNITIPTPLASISKEKLYTKNRYLKTTLASISKENLYTKIVIQKVAKMPSPKYAEKTFWFVVFMLEALLIIITNILTFIILMKKCRHLKPCFILMNLCVADILVGFSTLHSAIETIIMTPIVLERWDHCHKLNIVVFHALKAFAHTVPVICLAVVAIERLYAVFKPFQHRVATNRYYKTVIALTWLLSTFPGIFEVIFRCHSSRKTAVIITASFLVVSSLVIIIVSYLSIYIKLRYFPIFSHTWNSRMQMRWCKTLFYSTVITVVTSMPYGVVRSYIEACDSCDVSFRVYESSKFLLFLNSFTDLVVFAWKIPEFGAELKKMAHICARKLCRKE